MKVLAVIAVVLLVWFFVGALTAIFSGGDVGFREDRTDYCMTEPYAAICR